MMNSVLFSCVIPVKGPRPYFDEAVASLQNQGLGEELEVIIQDGDVEPDAGQSDALNKGFAKAKGEWFFWLNADDVLLPGALKKVREFVRRVEKEGEKSRVNWIAGDTVYIDETGKVTDVRRDARWYPWYGRHLSVWTGGPSAFFRRGLWQNQGGFDTNLKFVMDLDLWTRWARAGIRFKGVNEYLWGFRVHKESTTCKLGNKHEIEREFQEVLRRFNIGHEMFWRNMTRLASVLDGSRWHKIKDSCRFRGKGLFDCVGCMG